MATMIAAAFSSGVAVGEDGMVRVYIGTYTGAKSKGIYVSQLDSSSGALSPAELAVEVANPSFLAIHPSRKFLYAVSEVADVAGKPTGAVSAFAIGAKTGKLKLLNQQSSHGAGPCHLIVDRSGKNVLVANYGGGSCAALPIGEDGKVGEATAAIQHKGKSVNPARQEGPHAHSINVDLANRFAFVADLGLDKVLVYRFDSTKGLLAANDPPSVSVAPGAGPRHFAFHPSSKFAYVINEIANTVTAFAYDASRGALKEIQTITTLPKDFKETSHTAEVVVHPSGKFLYGSNRGHDSLAIFAIDPGNGKLTTVGYQPTGGKTPRNFAIDPLGTFLLAENSQSDTIVVFRIDPQTGELKSTGQTLEVASPVCVRFVTTAD
ncbi:MAG TPA: lactonase family protein [Planctomycetaceae bacterium]|nr:lactonase family protein [Planctomycetaceae bacterium]